MAAILGTATVAGAPILAATLSNPIGWAVAGVSLLVGLGLGARGLYRHYHNKNQLAKYRKNIAKDAPAFCSTTGDYHRWKMALYIFEAVCGPASMWKKRKKEQLVGWHMAWVLVGGESPVIVRNEVARMGIQGLIAFMKG